MKQIFSQQQPPTKLRILLEFCFSDCTCEVSCFAYCIPGGMVSRDSIVDGDCLRVDDWCKRYRIWIPYVVTKSRKCLGVGFPCAAYSPSAGERLWIYSNGKMETRHPEGGLFGREFSAFVIIAELWRPEVTRPEYFLAIFNGSWELATDHGFLNYGTISKFDRAGCFYICSSFCVTRLWSWQKRQLWRVERQSLTELIY